MRDNRVILNINPGNDQQAFKESTLPKEPAADGVLSNLISFVRRKVDGKAYSQQQEARKELETFTSEIARKFTGNSSMPLIDLSVAFWSVAAHNVAAMSGNGDCYQTLNVDRISAVLRHGCKITSDDEMRIWGCKQLLEINKALRDKHSNHGYTGYVSDAPEEVVAANQAVLDRYEGENPINLNRAAPSSSTGGETQNDGKISKMNLIELWADGQKALGLAREAVRLAQVFEMYLTFPHDEQRFIAKALSGVRGLVQSETGQCLPAVYDALHDSHRNSQISTATYDILTRDLLENREWPMGAFVQWVSKALEHDFSEESWTKYFQRMIDEARPNLTFLETEISRLAREYEGQIGPSN